MQIQMNQSELEEALNQYLKNLISISETKKFTFEFQSTRGGNGIVTTVNIVDALPPNSVIKVEEIKEETDCPVKESKITSINFQGVDLTPAKEIKRKTFFSDL